MSQRPYHLGRTSHRSASCLNYATPCHTCTRGRRRKSRGPVEWGSHLLALPSWISKMSSFA